LAEFTKEALQLPARIGQLLPLGGLVDAIQDEPYITAIGLMWLDMLLGQSSGSATTGADSLGSLTSAATNVFKRFRKKR
jgi:hypothetical protein